MTFLKAVVVLYVVLILSIGNVAAQTSARATFRIPFDFIVKKQTFPAGEYFFRRLNQANPDLLVLIGRDERAKTIFQTQRITKSASDQQPMLSFRLIEGCYFLSEITAINFGGRLVRWKRTTRETITDRDGIGEIVHVIADDSLR